MSAGSGASGAPVIKPVARDHPSNESGSRALSLCAIRLASGSMVTLPADPEPGLVTPGLLS
jgi:hypothetical protein